MYFHSIGGFTAATEVWVITFITAIVAVLIATLIIIYCTIITRHIGKLL